MVCRLSPIMHLYCLLVFFKSVCFVDLLSSIVDIQRMLIISCRCTSSAWKLVKEMKTSYREKKVFLTVVSVVYVSWSTH